MSNPLLPSVSILIAFYLGRYGRLMLTSIGREVPLG
jgi:hypothetical protein